jgi:ATP-dependent exoDNAse (exonuclease V) beta subunit
MAGSERGSGDEAAKTELTPEQRAIVEWGEGPLVVIAGAGTGKTRVIVERVAYLLDTQPELQPESLLVLTYNVKAAAELRQRITETVGVSRATRISVSNFHSFCHRILTESASEAGMPARPDVLDGIGQYLLLRDLRPHLDLVYHTEYSLAEFVKFINRAKDELVTPDHFDAFVERERAAFEDRFGPYPDVAGRQDANIARIELIELLVRTPDRPDNVMVVGDFRVPLGDASRTLTSERRPCQLGMGSDSRSGVCP